MTEPGSLILDGIHDRGNMRAIVANAGYRRMQLLGDALHKWRSHLGYSGRMAATKLKVSTGWYGMAEGCQIDPADVPPSTALRIIQATGLSDTDLGFVAIGEEEAGICDRPTPADPLPDPEPTTVHAEVGAFADRVSLSVGGNGSAQVAFLHPDFAERLALDLIRLAVTARANLQPEKD